MKKVLLAALLTAVIAWPAVAEDKSMRPDAMFRAMDRNGNGAVTQAEFSAYHDQLFKGTDRNGNGSLTLQELKDWKASQKSEPDFDKRRSPGERSAPSPDGD